MDPKTEKKIHEINKYVGLLLLPLFFVLFVSGYAIVNTNTVYPLSGGFLNRLRGYEIHSMLALPAVLVFLTHATLSARSVFKKWFPKKNLDPFFLVFFITLLVLFLHIGGGYS